MGHTTQSAWRSEIVNLLREGLRERNAIGYTSKAWNRAYCRRLISRLRIIDALWID